MQFNEFQRRLHHCHLDKETKFILSHMFEVQIEFSKHLDIATSIITQLTDKISTVLGINETLMGQIKELQRRGIMDGVSVESVTNEPEDDK